MEPMPRVRASSESPIGSMVPYGKFGADPIMTTVFFVIAASAPSLRAKRRVERYRLLIPKYCAALSNAGGGNRNRHLRFRDAFRRAAPIAVRLHREQNALRSAGRYARTRSLLGIAVEHVRDHRDDLSPRT